MYLCNFVRQLTDLARLHGMNLCHGCFIEMDTRPKDGACSIQLALLTAHLTFAQTHQKSVRVYLLVIWLTEYTQ